MDLVRVNRALISVHDKTELVWLGQQLVASGVELVSSGGTAQVLEHGGLPVTRVSDLTGFPEILGGRVKTLHPMIHGGILARVDIEEDRKDLADHGIAPFELVICNLYRFREAAADATRSRAQVIEEIDVGGPAMVRAAAKNHEYVAVVTSPDQYQEVAEAVAAGGIPRQLRRRLAARAFYVTAAYDSAVLGWFNGREDWPEEMVIPLTRQQTLRYGENPHQSAALYREEATAPWWSEAEVVQGKEMSFNNYLDAEAAWRIVSEVERPAAVVVKHTNACGAAIGPTALEAFRRAWEGDPEAAFGGVVALNVPLDGDTAAAIAEGFVEVLVVPSVEGAATLAGKPNLRVLVAPFPGLRDLDLRRLQNGFVVQERDSDAANWAVVSARQPNETELADLRLSWKVAAHCKSNSIVLVTGGAAVGIGAGDQSRVGAVRKALFTAGDRAKGAVAASDAFFPFRDSLDMLAAAGVTAAVHPGGSRRDQEIIEAADEHGLVLVNTGMRHFRH